MYLSKCRNYGHGKLLRTLKISGAAWGWAVLLETKPKGYQPTKQPPQENKSLELGQESHFSISKRQSYARERRDIN